MAKHNRLKRIGVGGPKQSSKKSNGDNNTQNKGKTPSKDQATSSPSPLLTTGATSPPQASQLKSINLLEKYINFSKETVKSLQDDANSSLLGLRAKHGIIDVPMEYRAQVQGRCQRQYFNDKIEGKLSDYHQRPERPAICHWIDEWKWFAAESRPFISDGLKLLPDDQVIQIDWRLISNSGLDEGFIRPVIAAGGWPLIPGSSIKGLFRRACMEMQEIAPSQVMKWCGGETANGDTQPGLLRFHGAWPADSDWREHLLDVAHPQQHWQVGIEPDNHSANAVVSLYKPRLHIAVSSRDPSIKEEDWKKIRSVLRHALGMGIGGRTCAGYGSIRTSVSSGTSSQELLFECSLEGQGPASKLLNGTSEFRPNMFRSAIRGMALRLFGGVTDHKTARQAVAQIFGSIDPEDGEKACIGLVASAFLQDLPDEDVLVCFKPRQHKSNQWAYTAVGTLQWRLIKSMPDNDQELLKQLLQALHGLVMALGGFGKSWRRPDHRVFYPEYYTNDKDDEIKSLIGCYWQWWDLSSLPSFLQVQSPEDLKRLLRESRSLAQQWLKATGKQLAEEGAQGWREVIHPERFYIWTRKAEDRSDAVAIHWFHAAPLNNQIFSSDNSKLKLKGTYLSGFVRQNRQTDLPGFTRPRKPIVGHIWNRLLPLSPDPSPKTHEIHSVINQATTSRNAAFQRPAKVKSNNLKYKAPPQSEKRRAYRGSQFITLDNMHKGSFLEIVVLNVPDGRKNVPDGLRQEFQCFINQMDQNQEFDANFERLIWRDVETRLS
jgi:CRISPR-associated protein Cmr6